MIGLSALFTFITQRTRYGRHIFAVGGNVEAARRAGIRDPDQDQRLRARVDAGRGGRDLAASRLLSVNQQSGCGDVLLLAIAGR